MITNSVKSPGTPIGGRSQCASTHAKTYEENKGEFIEMMCKKS